MRWGVSGGGDGREPERRLTDSARKADMFFCFVNFFFVGIVELHVQLLDVFGNAIAGSLRALQMAACSSRSAAVERLASPGDGEMRARRLVDRVIANRYSLASPSFPFSTSS